MTQTLTLPKTVTFLLFSLFFTTTFLPAETGTRGNDDEEVRPLRTMRPYSMSLSQFPEACEKGMDGSLLDSRMKGNLAHRATYVCYYLHNKTRVKVLHHDALVLRCEQGRIDFEAYLFFDCEP